MIEPAKLVWHVRGTSLHLLGAVHLTSRPIILGPIVESIVDSAEVVAFEADFRQSSPPAFFRLPPGERLSAHVAPALFGRALLMAGRVGLTRDEFEMLSPWAAVLTLMTRGLLQSGFSLEGLDRVLLARAAGRQLHFLEEAGAGLEAMRSAPLGEQLTGLENVVDRTVEGIADVRAMLNAFFENRPADLQPLYDKFASQQPVMYGNLLDRRNAIWIPGIVDLIRAGRPSIVTVGELHMVGPRSLPTLLAAEGFECRHLSGQGR